MVVQKSICKLLCASGLILFAGHLNAQNNLPDHALQVAGGYGKHGSGDLNGVVFGAEYINYLSEKFSLNYNFRAGIHDGKDEIIATNNTTGTRTDASVRFTTAGVQLGVNGQYSMLRNAKHELLVSLGAFGRYQSASNGTDGYSVYYPAITGIPTALIGFDNRSPMETFAVGGLLQLQYNYTFRYKMFIGVTPGFQTDTNGDALPQVAFIIGRRL